MNTPIPLALAVLLLPGPRLCAQSVVQFSSTTYNVTEGVPEVAITVQRTNNLGTVVTVDFRTTANGTATAGADFAQVASTLTFQPGETNLTVTVPILNDITIEPVETFQVTLDGPGEGAALGARTNATVRVTDNDKGLQIEYSSYRVAEDGKSVLIDVTRNDDGEFPVTVDFTTEDDTALSDLDYMSTNGTLTFAPGERRKGVAVPILNDGLKEAAETFRLTLNHPTGGGILGTPKSATITLMDNDPGVSFEQSIYAISEHESVLTVRVLRGNDLEWGPFTVDLSTADQTATGGLDYTATRATLHFAEGEPAKTVGIPVRLDDLKEPDERFRLVLDNLSGAASLGISSVTVHLFDTTGFRRHRIDDLRAFPGGGVELILGGGVSLGFTNDFDLYPVAVSTNILAWAPLALLQRPNATSNGLTLQEPEELSTAARFYRTPADHAITPYPIPTGPFRVGTVSRLVTDPTRRNRYPGLPGEAAFMVSVWYPAAAVAGTRLARLEDEQVVLNTSIGPVSRRYQFRSSAQPDVACADTGSPCPILLYSPGGTSFRTDLAERGPYLASYGYVVAAADPKDVPVTVFPDGTVLRSQGIIPPVSDRIRDLAVVLDELTRWNTDDPVFRGRLSVTHVAAAGWSYGAGAAAEFCRLDPRCRAALVFEGYFQDSTPLLTSGLPKPLLSIYANSLFDTGTAVALHQKAARDSIWFQIRTTGHESFSDYYWALEPGGGREAARILNTYTLWLLEKYLKDLDAPMPDPTGHPRIFNFQVK